VSWYEHASGKPSQWLLQTRTTGKWKTEILPASATSETLSGTAPDVIAISAVDRNGNTTPPAVVERKRSGK
ncbi:MAG TPA: hypothetical protein VHH88_07310, partial [Verrucomicrobiae bacterium]|nr:hypothetical protein [Verrucomicrobiae bacterium]